MKPLCLAANGLWLLSSLPSALAFRANLHRVAEVQEEVLRRILRRDPRYALLRSVEEYRRTVPIRTYDEMNLSHVPGVMHWERTSGSSGTVKRIPYTRELLAELNRAIAPWVVDLFVKHPGAFAGEAYWSVSPVLEEHEGFVTDEEYLGPVRARLVRAVQAVPRSVRLASDLDAFRRETLRHLVDHPSLSLISVWHPSFLTLLFGALRTLDHPRVQKAVHADDADMHRELWPKLRVISCWADANAARGAAELARLFPQAAVVPKGLLSTEGFVSFPLLAYRSHFFEFRDGEDVRLASEVETGKQYTVILTTGGGLYRYDTEDLIEVTGFHGRCPELRFLGRANHVSDHYGEKLNELFVRERLERVLREHGVAVRFAMLACEERAYALFVESDAPDALLLRVTAALETALRENVHYDYCRRLGQLGALALFRVTCDGAAAYLAAAGGRLGDVKLTALDRRGGWGGRFQGEWVGNDRTDRTHRTDGSRKTAGESVL